ncbi:Seipin [Oopsacas minuta]|uniref:Seipin n=1 Tax=Oopsacas minuta TaxID=111878 RepID=A0AAV7JTM1_9METZ|nr:Seipin [Oopsacas minuta]
MFYIDSIIFFCIRIWIYFFILPTVKILFYILECIINISKRITFYLLPQQTFPCRIFERVESMYNYLVGGYRRIVGAISNWILSDSPKYIVARIKELKTLLFLIVLMIWFSSSLTTVLFGNTYFYSPNKKFDFPFYFDYTYHGLPLTQIVPYASSKEIIQFEGIEPATIIPHAFIDLQELDIKLSIGEYYDVSIKLELPESYANRDAGVFMLNLTMYAENATLIATVGRPLLLKFKSNFFTYIQTFVFFPFYFLGVIQEKQQMHSLMFENFQENFKLQTESIYVSVSNPKIEIYESSMHFSLKPQGLNMLVLNWPWTAWLVMITLVVVSSIFLCILISQAILFILIDIVHTRLPEVADMLPSNDALMRSFPPLPRYSNVPRVQEEYHTIDDEDANGFINMSPLNMNEDAMTPPISPHAPVYIPREPVTDTLDSDNERLRQRH